MMIKRLSLRILFWLFISMLGMNGFFVFAVSTTQNDKSAAKEPASRAQLEAESKQRSTKSKKVVLDNAETLSYNSILNSDAQLLNGNVIFHHEGMRMFCDSAYFYDKQNSFEAFENIKMEQGDTLFVYGDYLYYDGNTRIAHLRGNVKLENRDMTLLTDSLNYDRNESMGYYFEGGMLIDPENELKSWYGRYSTETKHAVFTDHVVLTNEQFVLTSDTLHYNTGTRIADLVAPTVITTDSGTIYSSNGWYNTLKQESLLLDQSLIISNNAQRISGDSILYDRNAGIARVYGNMLSVDSAKYVTIIGDEGYHDDKLDFTYATKRALLTEYSGIDTLYMHADTLSASMDSVYRVMKGIGNVRFFRNDGQGVCGLFTYAQRDSAIYMVEQPVLWNQAYQISGDEIIAHLNDSTIDWAHVPTNSFTVAHLDSSYYNQSSGKEMKAYFKNKEVHLVEISGTVRTIFYPQETDSSLVGLNQTESSYLRMHIKNRQMERLTIWPSPKGSLTPIPLVTEEMKFLPGFRWLDYLRPKNKEDVMTEVEVKKTDVQPVKKRRVMQ